MSQDLGKLYDQHAPALFAFLLNLTRSEPEAGDCLQEVFMRLVTRPGLLEGVREPRAWLLRLAHRQAIDASRRRATRERTVERAAGEWPLLAPAEEPAEHAFRVAVAGAMGALGEEQRANGSFRMRFLTQAMMSFWDGTVRHQWSDGSLLRIEQTLASFNVLAALRFTASSERAFWNTIFEQYLYTTHREQWVSTLHTDGSSRRRTAQEIAILYYPRGWLRQNMAMHNRLVDETLARLSPVDGRERTVIPKHESDTEWLERNFNAITLGGLYQYFYRYMTPSMSSVEDTFLEVHAQIQQARLAGALERYYLQKKAYPETLAALVPAYLPVIPADIYDGQPLRYRRHENGGYVLWSIGPDRIDGGGKTDRQTDIKNFDWLWRQPPPEHES